MSTTDGHYELDSLYGCHLWTGKTGNNGRPIVWKGRTPISAYKLAYEEKYGPVKDGLVLDHVCRRATSCVNPDHLEAVTKSENERRKSWSYRCQIKKCPRGHSMEHALVTPEAGRLCRTCRKEQSVD